MKPFLIKPAGAACGRISLPGDKSIAHRCIIAGALSRGKTSILNFPFNKDCLSTINAFKKLGVKIVSKEGPSGPNSRVSVYGKGLYGLTKPDSKIFVGDSGTTLRLLLGVLAGQGFKTKLDSGKSLSQRPMLRVTDPLRMMGAKIKACPTITQEAKAEEYPPIEIEGGNLVPFTYRLPVASAQVKSAIILAGLFAKGQSCVIEPVATRDHTERILRLFKADIKVQKDKIFIRGKKELISPKKIYVPADISSASFFIVLSTILPDSQIMIKNVSLNPSRTGIIRVLKRMGANIKVQSSEFKAQSKAEPMGDLIVKSRCLKGTRVGKEEVPSLIDELPILMVAACFAGGETLFEDVGELRVKEADRIESLTSNLKKMGADISVYKSGGLENIVVRGGIKLRGASVMSFGDHRTVMSMIVAGLCAVGNTHIDDVSCIKKSFPDFLTTLKALLR